jgi:hypothetical protein
VAVISPHPQLNGSPIVKLPRVIAVLVFPETVDGPLSVGDESMGVTAVVVAVDVALGPEKVATISN